MSSLWDAVDAAFQRLEAQAGFEPRPVQRQMAQFVCEQLESGHSGMVEAPTGVGKSLAALLPAIAYSLQYEKRVVISTYTAMLAEQYWRKDLPLALSLFPNAPPVALAMGRTRYACLHAIRDNKRPRVPVELIRFLQEWAGVAQEGVESELYEFLRRKAIPERLIHGVWQAVAVPSACRARRCPYFNTCFYYQAREQARTAGIVITNHAFVLMDALVRRATEDNASLLDDYDFLILDEAHDFLDAAANALEFDLDSKFIDSLIGHAVTLSNQTQDIFPPDSAPTGFLMSVQKLVEGYAGRVRDAYEQLAFPPDTPREGVATRVAPESLTQMRAMYGAYRPDLHAPVVHAASALRKEIGDLYRELGQTLESYKGQLTEAQHEEVKELWAQFSREFALAHGNLGRLMEPQEGVSWIEADEERWKACYEPLVIADWLRENLWRTRPALLMSATLTIDGRFDFFREQFGFEAQATLQLPYVFDYRRQCALYLPLPGAIPPPPPSARAPGAEEYYQRLADQISALIQLTQGRALVLFASNNEMRAIRQRIQLEGVRILMQGEGAVADLAKQFREDVHSVLFGVRSFWTGFDAPGETLVNLILTRIPFEVPTTPLQRARQAWFEAQGLDAFRAWSLPMVKLQMRQGFGRLIRRADDWGIVALLDPRIRTKSYGSEILHNLPAGIEVFDTLPALTDWVRQKTGSSQVK
ncbi:MAG: ATP-dependent DNA helicase [Fimbriimonadales bacterium]|nr:MAG: ATP-dependent DNA helicase DinG [Fimbriimonadales bacterium]